MRPTLFNLAALIAFVSLTSCTGRSAPVVASTPRAVTITVGITPTDSGPWSASGAFEDSGTYHRGDVQLSGPVSLSPVGHTIHEMDTFTGSRGGSFTIKAQGLFTFMSGGGCCDLSGQWTIAGGTAKYAGLRGQGTFTRSGDTVIQQGQVQFSGR